MCERENEHGKNNEWMHKGLCRIEKETENYILMKLKIQQSIDNARKRWRQCLEEANGDLQKARELYDKM